MRKPFTDEEFLRIYDEVLRDVYRYTSRRCGGQRDFAEDITQDVWFSAMRDWKVNGIPEKPFGWLTTVSRNLILNHARRRPDIQLDALTPDEIVAAVERNDTSDSAEIAAVVNHALSRIPKAEATLLELFHFDELKVQQIADQYSTTDRAIEGRLRRARIHLRRQIEITLNSR